MTDQDITGQYDKSGNKLFSGEVTLLIRQRKRDKDKKPGKFLLIDIGQGFEYVSSLYQVENDIFVLDTNNSNMKKYNLKRSLYKLCLSGASGSIEELKQ